MQTDGFELRPDTCALTAVNVLNYLVLDDGEDVPSLLVFLAANVGSYTDEEGAFLLGKSAICSQKFDD